MSLIQQRQRTQPSRRKKHLQSIGSNSQSASSVVVQLEKTSASLRFTRPHRAFVVIVGRKPLERAMKCDAMRCDGGGGGGRRWIHEPRKRCVQADETKKGAASCQRRMNCEAARGSSNGSSGSRESACFLVLSFCV